MHGSILVLAKKKAAGPGGYFDPMQGPAPMAMGPMVFQVSEEAEAKPAPKAKKAVPSFLQKKEMKY